MKSVNLAILCFGKNLHNFCEYKNSMMQFYKDKKVKNDEIETLVNFVKALSAEKIKMSDLDCFFMGFQYRRFLKNLTCSKYMKMDQLSISN